MKKRKVLVFGMTDQIGGIESFIMSYIRNISKENIDFHFLVYNNLPAFADELKKLGCKIIVITGRGHNPLKCSAEIKRVLKENVYDAIWSNLCYLSDILVLKYAKKAGVKTRIVHAHSNMNMSSKLNGILHKINKGKIGKIATDFWGCSMSAGEFFFPKNILENGKFKLIPNAVNINTFTFKDQVRDEVRKSLGLENNLVIGNVGRLRQEKNHKFLLEIFKVISKKRPDARLLIVGDGICRPQIAARIKEMNLTEKVMLLGRRNDVGKLMCGMDSFVLPSLFEGLGIVLIEAQTCGLPCFTSKNVVPKETAITQQLTFIDLDEGAEKWADIILSKTGEERRDLNSKIKAAGYDIMEQVEMLKDFFLK